MTGEILIPEFASPALRSSVEEKEAFPFFQALIPLALEIGHDDEPGDGATKAGYPSSMAS
jgi:hypothetical protein|tara:strand:- start:49 stop:228 length:180 start_codon:yes stop_codon:yes gene_type:complete